MSELQELCVEVVVWFEENWLFEFDFFLFEMFMEVGIDSQFYYFCDWQQKVYEVGYFGMVWLVEYGGGGKLQLYQDVVNCEMVKQKVFFMLNMIGFNWVGLFILYMGIEEEKQCYILGIFLVEDIWCQGFFEFDYGFDFGSVQMCVVCDGDEYVVNGSKIWMSFGFYVKYMILLVCILDEGNKYVGFSYFLLLMCVEGVDIQLICKLIGEYGFVQIFFQDVCILVSCLMGEEGQGWQIVMIMFIFECGVQGGQVGGLLMMYVGVEDVVEFVCWSQCNGCLVFEDLLICDQLVCFLIEVKGDMLSNQWVGILVFVLEWLMLILFFGKLCMMEYWWWFFQFVQLFFGVNVVCFVGDELVVDGGKWQCFYFNLFLVIIGGGMLQVQVNIVGECVFGLLKS